MSKYSETILTSNGLDLATRAANGKVNFTLTRAATTADDLTKMSETDLQNLTVLPNETQAGVITNQDENTPNSKSIIGTEISFTNEGIKEGYSINAVGLYAKEDGKDEEVLYALNTAIEPEFMPDFADKVLLQFKITMYVIVGRTENVTITIDPTNTASKEFVKTEIAKIDVNDKIQDEDILSNLQGRLVYTDYKSKDKNNLTQVAEAIAKLPRGLKSVDDDGNITEYPAGSDFLIDISKVMNGSGGNNSGSIADDKASVLNGSISGRYQYWHGSSSLTDKTKITFEREAGTKLAYIGDGFQFLPVLKKTLVTRGVVSSTSSNIPFFYDPDNNAKDGYFVTTVKIPINITKERLLTGKEIIVQLAGIGETNSSSNESKSPELHIQYSESDNTISVWQEKGYEYDNLSDTKTGTIYDLSVTYINSYYVQESVSQLPSGVGLFSGSASGEIKLSGTNSFFDNVGSGIKIQTDNYLTFTPAHVFTNSEVNSIRVLSSSMQIPTVFNIKKEDLLVGKKIPIPSITTAPKSMVFQIIPSNNQWVDYTATINRFSIVNSYIQINNGSLELCLKVDLNAILSQHSSWDSTGVMKVTMITSVKDGD